MLKAAIDSKVVRRRHAGTRRGIHLFFAAILAAGAAAPIPAGSQPATGDFAGGRGAHAGTSSRAGLDAPAEADSAAGDFSVDRALPPGAPASAVREGSDTTGNGEPALQRMPEPVNPQKPPYPDSLARAGIEGEVLLELLVSETGGVESCRVKRGLHPLLDSAAVHAAPGFVFRPAIAMNRPVAAMIEYACRFSLDDVAVTDSAVSFEGSLRERGTRGPVAGAAVSVTCTGAGDSTTPVPLHRYLARIGSFAGQRYEGGALTCLTDSSGYFRFKGLTACSLLVTAAAPSYRRFHAAARIRKGERLKITYYLTPEIGGNGEVVVYGRDEQGEAAPKAAAVDRSQAGKVAGAGGDAVKVIASLPGVARSSYIGGALSIRGTDANQSLAYLDGLPYYVPFHMGTYKSSYNSDAIESTRLYAGGMGSRYGDALGGVLELTARDGRTDRWGGYADVNLVDATILAEGPLGRKFSILGSARASYLHALFEAAYDRLGDRLPLQLTPLYRDCILRVAGKPGSGHSIHCTFGTFHDEVNLLYPSIRGGSGAYKEQTDRTDAAWGWMIAHVGWDWQITATVKNSLRIGYVTEHDDLGLFGYFKYFDREGGLRFRDEARFACLSWLDVLAGAEGELYGYTGDIAIPRTDNSMLVRMISGTSDRIMPYVEGLWRPRNRLTLATGVRYNYWGFKNHRGSKFPEFTDYRGFDNTVGISADPCLRISGKFDVTDRQSVRIAGGNFVQMPPWEMHNDVYGNPDLTTQKSSQCIVEHEWRLTDLVSTDVQAYATNLWDLSRAAGARDSGLYAGDGKGRVRGVEVLVRHEPGKRLYGWLSYTLSRSRRWDFDVSRWIPFDYDQTHNLILVAGWRFATDLDAGLRLQYTTGNPATPVVGSVYNEHSHGYEQVLGPKKSERMPAHFQLDVKIGKTFRWDKWLLSTYLEVFNASYPFYRSPQEYVYNDDPYDYRLGRPDRRIVSQVIVPSLGVRAEF